MRQTDMVSLLLCAVGNLWLKRGRQADLDAIYQATHLSLDRPRDLSSPVHFEVHENFISFLPWLKEKQAAGARSLGLSIPEAAGLSQPGKTDELPASVRQAFSGASSYVLNVAFADRSETWVACLQYPRSSDLEVSDIRNFLAKSRDADALKGMMLWQNAYNLHFLDTPAWRKDFEKINPGPNAIADDFSPMLGYWDDFLRSISVDRLEQFVEAFSMCCTNIRISSEESQRWADVMSRHQKPVYPLYVYQRAGFFHPVPEKPADLPGARAGLRRSLQEIGAYARRENLPDWEEWFKSVEALLDEPKPEEPEFLVVTLRLAEVPLPAIQAFAAAGQAVQSFGGMGTWNDVPVAQTDEYERLSEQLLKQADKTFLAALSQL